MKIRAWHFTSRCLRDGRRPPEIGEWLVHEGEIRLCFSGLHASLDALDALRYAPGSIAARVECDEVVEYHDDKLVCRRRRDLWRYDASQQLERFARLCASDVLGFWHAPEVVRAYLRTGDPELRSACWVAVDSADRATKDPVLRSASWAAVASADGPGGGVRAAIKATLAAAEAASNRAADAADGAAAWAATAWAIQAAAEAADGSALEKRQERRLRRLLLEGARCRP